MLGCIVPLKRRLHPQADFLSVSTNDAYGQQRLSLFDSACDFSRYALGERGRGEQWSSANLAILKSPKLGTIVIQVVR
jgi:hypothetical protein